MMNASEKYYYCPSCKRFHEYGSEDHKGVNRKLCFYCDKKQAKKTRIIGNMQDGHSQICEKCYESFKNSGVI